MLKYVDTKVTVIEVPDEISLCISISNCNIHCKGCHSKYLWKDIGEILTVDKLKKLIHKNKGITCVTLLGGDGDVDSIIHLMESVKIYYPELKTCWYSGQTIRKIINTGILAYLDYLKEGPYIEEKGGLDKKGTNQSFFRIERIPYSNGKDVLYTAELLNYKFRKYETKN